MNPALASQLVSQIELYLHGYSDGAAEVPPQLGAFPAYRAGWVGLSRMLDYGSALSPYGVTVGDVPENTAGEVAAVVRVVEKHCSLADQAEVLLALGIDW